MKVAGNHRDGVVEALRNSIPLSNKYQSLT
jgi:hypothetical protein